MKNRNVALAVLIASAAGFMLAPGPAVAAVDNYETVIDSSTIQTTDTLVAMDVYCPTGKVALGGGASAVQTGAVWVTEWSRPATNAGTVSVWQAQFRRLSGTPSVTGNLNIRVICATD